MGLSMMRGLFGVEFSGRSGEAPRRGAMNRAEGRFDASRVGVRGVGSPRRGEVKWDLFDWREFPGVGWRCFMPPLRGGGFVGCAGSQGFTLGYFHALPPG